MSKIDVVFAILLGVLVGFFFLVLIFGPSPKKSFYPDQAIFCNTTDEWGLNNAKTTCYKVQEIKE